MLHLRKEQMDAFRQAQTKRFHKELENYLRDHVPECRSESARVLRDLVQTGLKRADEYGMSDPDNAKRFVRYVGLYGFDFGQTPDTAWATPILEKWASGSERLDELDREAKYHGGGSQ